ncbi:hypothetical protein M3Y94_00990200 [Aphelenchoides besseyi]|nr:hypothetical protein M3Y94_00990200 [Aphelenchoides besseyi]
MRTLIVLLGLVSALAMLEVGAIKCYKCSSDASGSEDNPNCKAPKKIDCPQGVKGCLTTESKENGNATVTKDCGRPNEDGVSCGGSSNNWKQCQCLGDLCNGDASSSSNRPAALGLFLVFLFVLA